MSYDPIHDTYTPAKKEPEPEPEPESPPLESFSRPQSNQESSAHPEPPLTPAQQNKTVPISALVDTDSTANALTPEPPHSVAHRALNMSSILNSHNSELPMMMGTGTGTGNGTTVANTSLLMDDTTEYGDDDDDDSSKNSLLKTTKKKGKGKSTNVTFRGFRPLKKADGEAFWRKDIQYDFLKALFSNEQKVFTNYFNYCSLPNAVNTEKLTFAELYIRTLAESSKCSKILRERLIKDVSMATSVAKICLLVNAGRMNTTVNFVPEMRSNLRTYHSIPSLQTDATTGYITPLQDTPRLKSILKAVSELDVTYKNLMELLEDPPRKKPNTNIIHLIFLLSTCGNSIRFYSDLKTSPNNIYDNNEFMEFFTNVKIDPENRAKRFLWMMYTYLETSFLKEELDLNPFGAGSIPPVESIDESKLDEFDRDTDLEIKFSQHMYNTRMRYLKEDDSGTNASGSYVAKSIRQRKSEPSALPTGDLEFGDGVDDNEISSQLPLPTPTSAENKKHSLPPSSVKKTVAKKRKIRKRDQMQVPSSPTNGKAITSLVSVGGDNNPIIIPPSISGGGGTSLELNYLPFPTSKDKYSDKNVYAMNVIGSSKYPTDDISGSIQYPIGDLGSILESFAPPRSSLEIKPDPHTLVSFRQNIIIKTQTVIKQALKATGSNFGSRKDLLEDWLKFFFQYKVESGNGLLALEWEDIRQELASGLESYIYTQQGKIIAELKGLSSVNHLDPNSTSEDSVATKPSNMINVNSKLNKLKSTKPQFPISGKMIDFTRFEYNTYVPIHESDRNLEKSEFVNALIGFARDISKYILEYESPSEDTKLTFDLAKGKIRFT
ncbi:uncharacterized protein KQ657_004296 [Scheffersomyces spartinae]|uniref:Ino eighty subunit 1 n=1 Tax=Scheffersomyces spartinae TaxID=45513 RepID=A0A9P7VBE2_9ASCO|nr:uncharacterized protein KQ657_004296 [Scheffersomyces spartinae]KAG7194620.1 hypothetical protein KQ657_004296 [Scheffersomyces spartinae]